MNVMLTFLGFRLKQFWRSVREIGIPIILVALVVTVGVTFRLLEMFAAVEGKEVGIISFLLVLGVHAYRTDGAFLRQLHIPIPLLLFFEYALLLLPVSILLLFFGKIEPALFWQLGFSPVLLFPLGFLKKGNAVPFLRLNQLSPIYFEIKHGLRKLFFVGVFFYLIALGCPFFVGTLVLFSIFLLLLLPSFFEYFEPKEIIELAYHRGQFLRSKIWRHLIFFHLLLLPHYLAFLFFHAAFWYLGVACCVGITLTIIFGIVYKYAAYRPNFPKHQGSSFHAIFFGTLVLPGFVLVSVGLIIYFWQKANTNLAYYYA
ncbi:MAG: hypothetical protein AAF573_15520 [Bacteroidota bacterium]